jgi:hypothetical protein
MRERWPSAARQIRGLCGSFNIYKMLVSLREIKCFVSAFTPVCQHCFLAKVLCIMLTTVLYTMLIKCLVQWLNQCLNNAWTKDVKGNAKDNA